VTAQPSNLTLIGMPGSGKSTVGRLLAERYRLTFLDTDALIESGEGCRLEELIVQHGLKGFLAIEARYLRNLQCEKTLIAPGGSAVYDEQAMSNLRRLGPVAYLDVPLAEIETRVGDLQKRGVVIAPGKTVMDLYHERHPLYVRHADLRIPCTGDDPERTALDVATALEQFVQGNSASQSTPTP
jgi:shikimate kinase